MLSLRGDWLWDDLLKRLAYSVTDPGQLKLSSDFCSVFFRRFSVCCCGSQLGE